MRLWLSDDGNPPKFSTVIPVHMVNKQGLGECGLWLIEAMRKNKKEKAAMAMLPASERLRRYMERGGHEDI